MPENFSSARGLGGAVVSAREGVGRNSRWDYGLVPLLGCLLIGGWLAPRAQAVTPESPEVKALVEKGLAYLEKNSHLELGGRCLIGLAFFKNGRPVTHPKIKAAIDDCYREPFEGPNPDNYSLGCALIFLCELNDSRHSQQIERYLRELLRRQKRNGAWGYPSDDLGDTSQTQYGCLGMWMAERHGYDVPLPAIEHCLNWLLRTQDPSGCFGYQGVDSGTPGKRSQQVTTSVSLTAAGLGSVYMLADLLDFGRAKGKPGEVGPALPKALQEVSEKKLQFRRRPPTIVDGRIVADVMAAGDAWFEKNFIANAPAWKHYYMYGYERYASFRELFLNRFEEEPVWYDKIYEDLKLTQDATGLWNGEDTQPMATAFSVLVLSRSARKSIKIAEAALGDGQMVGGLGLPPNAANLQEKNGRLVDSPLSGSVDELLNIVSDADNPELARMAESSQTITLDADVTKRAGQITRLRALVSAGSFETRIVAVRSLGKVRDFDNVPLLLYALTDPDIRVVREADKGLRFISRKFAGVEPLDPPLPERLKLVRDKWREWYLGIRPDAELLN